MPDNLIAWKADDAVDPVAILDAVDELSQAGRAFEADALLARAETHAGAIPEFTVVRAFLAERNGLRPAAEIWAHVRATLRTHSIGYTAGARVAREAGQFEEADRFLAQARARFPEDVEPIVESGWLAHVMGNWPLAALRWRLVRQRAPQHIVGFVNGAVAARESGDADLATQLLDEAIRRFPGEAEPAIERAWLSQHAGDWAAAASRWEAVRESFPDVLAAHLGFARAMREQRRSAEADAVLAGAAERFPDSFELHAERCWVAHMAHDWPEAEQRWRALRTRFPERSAGYTGAAVALRELHRPDEAETVLRQAIDRFPAERNLWTERAWLATARRDWPEAARRWEAVRARFPDFAEAYRRGASALAEIWDDAGAEALLVDAMARFPADHDLPSDHAALALARNRLDEAAERYAALRENHPQLAEGYLGAARVLRSRFELAEAEAVLVEGQDRVPDEPRLWLEHALIPVYAPLRRDRDPEEALRRLDILRARFPLFASGHVEAVRLLRELGRNEAAEAMACEARDALPGDETLSLEHALLAAARGDWGEALARYEAARAAFPGNPGGDVGCAQALASMGRDAEAEDLLRETIARFPAAAAGYTAYAELATRREEWAEALKRWSEGQRRFPDDTTFAQRIFDVRLQLAETEAEAGAPVASDGDPRSALRDLVMRFESLGGREIGCEFGMLQREFGAEPLGLLRWADMPIEGIIAVLESRFAGVGDAENTEVFVNHENGRPEYCTRDLRGFMFMRAFVYEDEVPIERMRKQAVRRLAFLKNKLIADLKAGEKIFVWRCTERNLDDDELRRLHSAVASYGPNTLLYVRYEDAEHPNGTVEMRSDGLLIGYIDRFKMGLEGQLASAPPTASWVKLCRSALSTLRLGSQEPDVSEPHC